jgi:transposase
MWYVVRVTHIDAPTLPQAAQEEKRRTAVRLREQGLTFVAIAATLGVSRAIVATWWKRYEAGGKEALASGTRGRRIGAQRRLTARQEAAIQRAITETTPDQLTLPFALWTRAANAQRIQRRTGIALPVRTMGHYRALGLHRAEAAQAGLRAQPEAIAHWLKTAYPRIKRQAAVEGAEIYWGDETSLSTGDPRGRGVGLRGRTPVRPIRSRRQSVRYVSAISHTGLLRFRVLTKAIDVPTRITFCTRVCKDAARKVYLILDHRNVHMAATVKAWLAANAAQIAVFSLPSYSPALNPDEYLTGDLKVQVAQRVPARDRTAVERTATGHLRSLQRRPAQVQKFFRHPRPSFPFPFPFAGRLGATVRTTSAAHPIASPALSQPAKAACTYSAASSSPPSAYVSGSSAGMRTLPESMGTTCRLPATAARNAFSATGPGPWLRNRCRASANCHAADASSNAASSASISATEPACMSHSSRM